MALTFARAFVSCDHVAVSSSVPLASVRVIWYCVTVPSNVLDTRVSALKKALKIILLSADRSGTQGCKETVQPHNRSFGDLNR